MTESAHREDARPGPGLVEELARDDVARKRFLRMAGRRMGARDPGGGTISRQT
jgi:hypothetical protein